MEERDPGRQAAFQAVQDMLDLSVVLWRPRQLFRTEHKGDMQVFSYNEKSQLRCANICLPHTQTEHHSELKQGYDLELMKNIRLIDAWPDGRVVWELDITPFYANLNGV
jgi:hypothetical protein